MLSCIFLVTLSNANDIIDVWGKEGASQAFKKYFKEEEWTLNRALVALGSKVPKEALTVLRHEGRVGKSMLRSSTALMQHDQDMISKKKRKGDEWTEAELNRAREILNGMYDTEQAELDVLLVDCKKFLGTLKEEYLIHQGACDKTLAALKANYDLAAFDYHVALKIQNMSTCDDAAKQAAIDAENAADESFLQTGNATHPDAQAKAKADP